MRGAGGGQGARARPGQDTAGAEIGTAAAAELAAAACSTPCAPARRRRRGERHLSLAGDLRDAVRGTTDHRALAGWTVTPQRGRRVRRAARPCPPRRPAPAWSCRSAWTPRSVTAAALRAAAGAMTAATTPCSGPASTAAGGCWSARPGDARALASVPMSTPSTFVDTQRALERAGLAGGATADARRRHRRPTPSTWRPVAPRTPVRRSLAREPGERGLRSPTVVLQVFASALRGAPTGGRLGHDPVPLPVDVWRARRTTRTRSWSRSATARRSTSGAVPGRLTEALAARGHAGPRHRRGGRGGRADPRARGCRAACATSSTSCPARAGGGSALLADGNIGIGGDPVALLRRGARGAGPARPGRRRGGRGPGCRCVRAGPSLECGGTRSRPFRWAVVGVDDVAALAPGAGLDDAGCPSTRAAGARCSEEAADDAAGCPARGLHLAAAQPRRRRAGRALARRLPSGSAS